MTYHDKFLEICFESRFFISDNSGSIWAMWRSIFDFWKKKFQFFPLKGKKLTRSHIVQKLAQIVRYGQTVIGESCRVNPGDGFQYLSSYQNVSRWKNRNRWKNFQFFFLTNFLKIYFKAFPEKPFFSKKTFFRFLSKIRF